MHSTNSRSQRQFLAAILGIGLALRVIGLSRFPALEADEGLWTRSSKNYVVFRDWFLDKHTHLFLSPAFHGLTVVAYSLLWPSTAVARGVSAIAGAVSIGLLYLLVKRTTENEELALVAALIMTAAAWSIIISRRALIEPLEVSTILGSAVLLTGRSTRAVILGGMMFGVVLLTKINAIFMLAPFALLLVWMDAESRTRHAIAHRVLTKVLPFAASAIIVAGVVYSLMYLAHPIDFRNAFRYELDGVHFARGSDPLIRIGRFGVDPRQEIGTILKLFRIEPLLLLLAIMGCLASIGRLSRWSIFFGSWLVIGAGYFLTQLYQPDRYFYLLMPAFAYFGAVAVTSLAGERRVFAAPLRWAILAVFCAFELAHVTINATRGDSPQFASVVQWARKSTNPTDGVLASAMLCTDLPDRAYGFYRLVKSKDDIPRVVDGLHLRYVVVDDLEWPQSYRAEVAQLYAPVQHWPHITVYRVN